MTSKLPLEGIVAGHFSAAADYAAANNSDLQAHQSPSAELLAREAEDPVRKEWSAD